MIKPKVGDVIRRIAQSNGEFVEGETYTILGMDSDGSPTLLDTNGITTYLEDYEIEDFELVKEYEDLGMISLSNDYGVDKTGTTTIQVTVDAQGLETLRRLQEQHEKATKAAEIKNQIAELERKLKEL